MMYDYVIKKPNIDEALEHYGVKGMKWKKRKKNLTDKGYNSAESEKKYTLNLRTKELSDDNYANANKATSKNLWKSLIKRRKKYKKGNRK